MQSETPGRSRSWRRTRGRIIVRHRRDGGIDSAEHILVARGRVRRRDQRLKRRLAHVLERSAGIGAGRPGRQVVEGRLGAKADHRKGDLRGRQARRNDAVVAGQRLELADLLFERQLVAGLLAKLKAEVGVLAGRFLRHRRRQRRLGLHHRQHEAGGQRLAGDEVRAHRRHAASSKAENMLVTVVKSFADEA